MAELIFITGGTRSGKSGYAQRRAEAHSGRLLYVATAAAGDAEMTARIARHRAARQQRWETLEEPLALGERLPAAAAGKDAVLVDCVTLWLSNLYFQHREEPAPALAAVAALIEALPRLAAPLYLVSNELGSGVVPEHRLARAFRDLAGEANQLLAAAANEAWLVVAGLPLRLK